MFKSIDSAEDSIEGFKYVNKAGDEEFVVLDKITVFVQDAEGEEVCIFIEDIPKLIKALQLAYDYKGA